MNEINDESFMMIVIVVVLMMIIVMKMMRIMRMRMTTMENMKLSLRSCVDLVVCQRHEA